MNRLLKTAAVAGLSACLTVVLPATWAHADGSTPVIGANNTTYSPQNFSGRWKLRQSDGEICLVELIVTDASPHDIGLRACTDAAITVAAHWELQVRDLAILNKDKSQVALFKVTEPNKLEGAGMILFR